MKKTLLTLLAVIIIIITYFIFCPTKYAVAIYPTPVLWSSNFPFIFGGTDGSTLKLDEYEQVDEVDFIAFPGTVFTIIETRQVGGTTIHKVYTQEIPESEDYPLYLDARFVKVVEDKPKERKAELPKKDEILTSLKEAEELGLKYVWGGNFYEGIPRMTLFYPPTRELSEEESQKWTLRGVDCSGLLYRATNGYSPRNSHKLTKFGKPVPIAGKTAEEITEKLKPLDIIVWGGHIMIVFDEENIIESRHDYDKETEGFDGGVRIRNTLEVIQETMEDRRPVNNYNSNKSAPKQFVVRRWI